MDHESQPLDRASNAEPTENLDFEPLYDLSERDYQSIIHRLVDAVVGAVGSMRQGGQIDEAYELANRVNDILLDYDDDVAECVWMAAYGDGESVEGGLAAYGDGESVEGGLAAARESFLLPDGRQIVTWEEKPAEIYTIRWEW